MSYNRHQRFHTNILTANRYKLANIYLYISLESYHITIKYATTEPFIVPYFFLKDIITSMTDKLYQHLYWDSCKKKIHINTITATKCQWPVASSVSSAGGIRPRCHEAREEGGDTVRDVTVCVSGCRAGQLLGGWGWFVLCVGWMNECFAHV